MNEFTSAFNKLLAMLPAKAFDEAAQIRQDRLAAWMRVQASDDAKPMPFIVQQSLRGFMAGHSTLCVAALESLAAGEAISPLDLSSMTRRLGRYGFAVRAVPLCCETRRDRRAA